VKKTLLELRRESWKVMPLSDAPSWQKINTKSRGVLQVESECRNLMVEAERIEDRCRMQHARAAATTVSQTSIIYLHTVASCSIYAYMHFCLSADLPIHPSIHPPSQPPIY
jgi:hypothetical protein